MLNTLPTFEGYTVDERLREFRKMVPGEVMSFVSFDSAEGQEILGRYKS